ncbi:MAG: methyltransferase [Sphingomonas bacterium]|uniref:hypothetical protein n=1 Tax=Sphingomonas bacterium TaxID=1895847 RepID=UPI0026285ABF|nr:hypothetical protein [Sphingomonas bacterium]MDB5695960.1 methyltransferase [Sphingomonas bacterium]
MVERTEAVDPRWVAVDDYIAQRRRRGAERRPEGGVLDADSDDERIQGTRALFDAIAAEPRLTATAVQTAGAKKLDGFLLAVVTG